MTTEDPTVLTEARFVELAEAYGGEIARWPEAVRADATRMASRPGCRAALEEAAALDALLGPALSTTAAVSDALQSRMLADAAEIGAGYARAAVAATPQPTAERRPSLLRQLFGDVTGMAGGALAGAFGMAATAGLALGVITAAPTSAPSEEIAAFEQALLGEADGLGGYDDVGL